jgi:signal transduction histidine kinase
MYIAFGLFIVTCGFTHFLDVYTVWRPIYWTDGMVRALTAVASVGTAIALPTLVPKAVLLAQGAQAARERGIKLESAYEQLGEVFEKTKELDNLKTQFFANVSHELRTPLTLVLGPSERMKLAGDLSDQQLQDLDVIIQNARKLLKHVNDLLDIAKLEAGKMKPNYSQLDLSKAIRLISSNFDGLAKEREIEFTLHLPEYLPAQLDIDMMQSVLLNLLSNAFKFVSNRGKIQVSAVSENSIIKVTVQDNGPGVPKPFRNVIFEKFRQAENGSNRSHGGTGLGLSIAKEFVNLHLGHIFVSDTPGGGASFTFEIPSHAPEEVIAPPHAYDEVQNRKIEHLLLELDKSTESIEALVPVEKKDKGTVLIVEDNLEMNRYISEILFPNYSIICAFNGKEGLEKSIILKPDLILSDIMMPVMSGDQMLEEIRKNQDLSDIPVILLTAKADSDLLNRLLRESAQDYMIKPFSSDELLVRVKNLVTMKRAKTTLQRELATQLQDLDTLAQELAKQKRELQETSEKFRIARDEAEKANRVKSTFLSMISHEMRTPMTSLKLQLELLKRREGTNLSPAQKKVIDRLDRSSDRSIELIDNLIEYTRLQSGKIEPKIESLNLASVVNELIESLKLEAQEKNLDLKMTIASTDIPTFQNDRLLVRMILRNLLTNAIKYTDSGSIDVLVSFESGQHRVAVKDTGLGIPMALQENIFKPFEQLTPLERKSKPGFGLGLAIAKETSQSLGGDIQISSEVGKGSTFIAILPSLPIST